MIVAVHRIADGHVVTCDDEQCYMIVLVYCGGSCRMDNFYFC